MDNNKIQLIGAPCGYHGQYTFFKAFKYFRNGKHKILSLSDFFFVKLWSDLDLMSIGEVQLLWMDKNSEQVLASLRLYFLPENTPEGRSDDHGEDEVLAISEKVVLRVEDLLDRIIDDAEWSHGLTAVWDPDGPVDTDLDGKSQMLLETAFDFDDIVKEKQLIGDYKSNATSAVVVLSFPRYCRYRGIKKRLEGFTGSWSRNDLVVALGGFAAPCKDTRVVFCKETFDYPDLEGHELLCNHLAPNLKGRPRRRRKKRCLSPGGSESNESESSISTVSSVVKVKQLMSRNGIRCNNLNQPRRSNRVSTCIEEKDFLVKLHGFMKSKRTPIGRLPNLGFKEIDLYAFYKRVQKLGGYNVVTANRMWKLIYDELGGDPRSTSAATCTRRHYERLLLQYELNVRGVKAKQFASYNSRGDSECDDDESDSDSNNRQNNVTDMDLKGRCTTSSQKAMMLDGKMSALRSVRTKGEKSLEIIHVGSLPPDKENIPLSNECKLDSSSDCMEEPLDKSVPELIDITDQDSPAKIGKTSLPALKKRKLEILKEGGLEVTAIASSAAETSTSDRRPSVIQHASPLHRANSQISITVTPDVSHMLGSPDDTSPPPQSPRASVHSWPAQRVTQSRSIYAHSESTVYGNPKDGLVNSARLHRKPVSAVEVLDLRVSATPRPAHSHSRSNSAVNTRDGARNFSRRPQALPALDGRTLLGSNLEITVVDVNNKPQQLQTQPHPQSRHSYQQRKSSHRPSPNDRHNNHPTTHLNHSVHQPPVINGRSASRESSRSRVQAPSNSLMQIPQLFPSSYLPQIDPRGKNPYPMSLMDTSMYYPGMYYSSPNYMPAMAPVQPPPPIFAPTAEHLQLYKDLMSHHHTMLRAQQSTAGFLGLPRDGSTSITPVSQGSTPTSKSK